jgi:hypothetical protein
MAKTPDLCPTCNSLVRHDWIEQCGACGYEWQVITPVAPVPTAPKARTNPAVLAIGAIVAVVIVGAGLYITAPKSQDTQLASAPAASTPADAATALAQAKSPTTSDNAVDTPTTGAPAPPSTTTSSTSAPSGSFASAQSALSAAATATNSTSTFSFTTTMTSSTAGQLLSESGSWDGSKNLMSVTFNLAGINMSMILDNKNQVAYVKSTQLSNDSNWDEMSTASLTGIDPSDPTGGLAFLKSTNGQVSLVGTEKVSGITTKHYTWTLTGAQMEASGNPSLTTFANQYGKDLTLKSDAWIDSNNVVRQLVVVIKTSNASVGTITLTENITNVDGKVSVSLPPASEIKSNTTGV